MTLVAKIPVIALAVAALGITTSQASAGPPADLDERRAELGRSVPELGQVWPRSASLGVISTE